MTTTVPPVRRITQDTAARLTYTDDWTSRLADAYPGQTITIVSATASATGGAVIDNVVGSGTSVVFRLSVSAVTPSTDVEAKIIATLSNGDTDSRPLTVGAIA